MSLLDGQPGGLDPLHADVITVSTLLGFLATRVELLQPVTLHFEYEPGPTRRTHEAVVRRLDQALYSAGFDSSGIDGIKAQATEPYNPQDPRITSGIAITGRPGGAASDDKHRPMKGLSSMAFAQDLLLGSRQQGAVTTQERGAYYGVVDDPVTEQVRMVSTVRRLIDYNGHEGRRWSAQTQYHGVIRAGPNPVLAPSWGSFERANLIGGWAGNGRVVGYCHGMNWAIQHCKLIGPWTTPYEVAVGNATTKLASCFGCTTFMYATGYPPSAIHLGRAESWVPLPTTLMDNPDFNFNEDTRMIQGLNDLWARDVASYLELGADIVAGAGVFEQGVRDVARQLLMQVKSRISTHGKRDAANMLLDALTVHDSETNRLVRSLKKPLV
ncbi:hypothetical protein D7V80_24255 [Corallococcus sp. CA054B]|uniref:hypothetical protein n=1 Tax=Corallococcus sp. CA054B TaxID=2316734 RepID=UPI000EA24BB5|nr:hypothetical protein [Corallococcus sp. CA054B]RKG65177.1 hypothetical protein D7V80_24255 [Corallococcus sp. CA054B]